MRWILPIGHTTSAAEEIQKLAPRAEVVKAFNTIFAQLLPAEAREGRAPVQLFVAADDGAAKAAVRHRGQGRVRAHRRRAAGECAVP